MEPISEINIDTSCDFKQHYAIKNNFKEDIIAEERENIRFRDVGEPLRD